MLHLIFHDDVVRKVTASILYRNHDLTIDSGERIFVLSKNNAIILPSAVLQVWFVDNDIKWLK